MAWEAKRLLEDGSSVVGDRIGSSHLCHEVDEEGQTGAVEDALGTHLEEVCEATLTLVLAFE